MNAYFFRGVETRFIGRGSPGGFNASYSTGTQRVAKRGTICRNCRKSPTRDHRRSDGGGVRRGSMRRSFGRSNRENQSMSGKNQASTFVYPALGSRYDLWFLRMSGSGLGNCFYNYFQAVALAERCNARVIVPPWFSVKIGPMLRGQSGKRFYLGMFKPYRGDIGGLRKLWILLSRYWRRNIVEVDGARPAALELGALNVVTVNSKFTFDGLYPHREAIRQRILGIVHDPVPPDHCWGRGKFIAVHVRLGEFAQVSDTKLITGGMDNVRIPLSWYVSLVKKLRACYPQMPIFIFSDGKEHELMPLLELGATLYRSGSDMTDLLAMSAASILVGSNSTYSRWAVFFSVICRRSGSSARSRKRSRPAPIPPFFTSPLMPPTPLCGRI